MSYKNIIDFLFESGSAPSRPDVSILPRYLDVREGESVDFRCRANGIPAPNLRWTSAQGAPLNPLHTFTDGVFHIPRASKSDDGTYVCTGNNPSGEDSQTATLIVRGALIFVLFYLLHRKNNEIHF